MMLRTLGNLDDVIILCQDLERMKHFYQEVFGFSLCCDGKDWIDFHVGTTRLALRPRGRVYDGPAPLAGSASVQLAFRVAPAQVDACFAELQQKGVVISEPPTNQDWGHRTLFFKDPEGNLLEIYADLEHVNSPHQEGEQTV